MLFKQVRRGIEQDHLHAVPVAAVWGTYERPVGNVECAVSQDLPKGKVCGSNAAFQLGLPVELVHVMTSRRLQRNLKSVHINLELILTRQGTYASVVWSKS